MQHLINACESTVKGKFSYIPKQLSNCSAADEREFMLIKSPYNTSMFNIAWLNSVSEENYKNEFSKLIKEFFPFPFALWIGPNSKSTLSESQLNEIGFIKEANELGMSLDLSTYHDDIQTIDTHDIFEVKDSVGMENFIHVLEAYDPFVREYYMNVINELGAHKDNPFRFFWLSVNGKAACISSLFFNGDHCGIFDVLTHEEHRKRGYAFRLMKYLLSYAKKHGSSYMCLTASSPEAVNLYTKIGFKNFGNYACYEFKSHS